MSKRMSIAMAEVVQDLVGGWLDGFGFSDAYDIWPERSNEHNAKRQTFRRLLKSEWIEMTGYETIVGNPVCTLTMDARHEAYKVLNGF